MSGLSEGQLLFAAVVWGVSLLSAIAGALLFARTLRQVHRGEGGTPAGALLGALGLIAIGFAGGLMLTVSATVLEHGPELVAEATGSAAPHELVGAQAPLLAWTRLEGGTDHLAGHRGEVVLVNFWATWCGPCRHEMPALERLQRDYRDRGLFVVHLSKEREATIRTYLAQFPSENEHGRDPHSRLDSSKLPTTYVVDRDGIVRDVLVGGRSYAQLEAAIRDWI